jgi:hypothetical protein
MKASHRLPQLLSLASILGNDNVFYHSLLGLTSGQQVCGRFVRNGDYSLKWIAATKCAQWHS